jgi:small subunit ribosomal protein S6
MAVRLPQGEARGRAAWPGIRCFRILSIRAFPEGLQWLGAGLADGVLAEGFVVESREPLINGKGQNRMPLYEHVYLARQDLTAQQVDDLTAQYKGVIEQMGGSIPKTEYWGVKSLNYRIRKNRKAHFTLLNIDAPPAALGEIERQQRLNEDVLRYLTIRVEAHEEGPSAMMRKVDRDRERDDRRGERGDRGERRRERGPGEEVAAAAEGETA